MENHLYRTLQDAINQQDENAFFEVLFISMSGPVLATAIAYKKPYFWRDGDDVLQEVAISVRDLGISYFKGFSREHFERYIRKMAKNICLNLNRGRRSFTSYDDKGLDTLSMSLPTDASNLDDGEEFEMLLKQLPPIQEEIIRLRLKGFLLEEIATQLNRGLSNVKYHSSEAMEKLTAKYVDSNKVAGPS